MLDYPVISQPPPPGIAVVVEDVVFGWSEIKMGYRIEDIMLAKENVRVVGAHQARDDLFNHRRIAPDSLDNRIIAKVKRL
jgi:hypothetical protein